MKARTKNKQFTLDLEIAIAIEVAAAQKQITTSAVVEQAVSSYLNLDKKRLVAPNNHSL